MLAADELHPNDLDKLRATGYLARNYFLFNRHQWMDETVEHVGKGFLGLTINCAKCHDHKYDPVFQLDYYRLRAFFEPYHVRVDMLPGEADLARDGIPRAFDGLPDEPTYRFIRGQENNRDKSSPVSPGIPALLELGPLIIEPVELPLEASQPQRRAWIAAAHQTAARRKLVAAEAKLAAAREKLARLDQASDNAAVEAKLELQVAEVSLEVAQTEERSIPCRAAAMQAAWTGTAPGDLARAAARTERELTAAQARLALAEAELRLHKAADAKREAAAKEVAAAREKLDKALKEIEAPGDQFTNLVGAKWIPTRFFNSGKDDPVVPFPSQSTGRRTALAGWITDRRNPLTARVAVNHLWTRHFGAPLVPTVFDFGRNGVPPANPALLDWLASELIDSGWSMKHLHRLMVQSATYRQSSSALGAETNLAIDPDNRHFWHRTPIRIESEVVRDSILALAGTLDTAHGGPPVPRANQENSTRRSLYLFHSNNERNLFLTTFDAALVSECYRREQSIVPQQALALANSRLVLDAAPLIAERLTRELTATDAAADDDAAFIRLAFSVVLAAEPSQAEIAASAAALDTWKKLPERPAGETEAAFARANLIWVLLNHHDFVTLR
jgi:hypothetical protein